MRRYRLNDVLAGTRGELRGSLPSDHVFTRLERDARHITAGDLYIAIVGEVFDGNAFVHDATVAGAAAAIVNRSWADAQAAAPLPIIVVDDTTVALQRWASWQRDRVDVRVIGVTGSIGKTSAKESIAAVIAQQGTVYRSPGSFNNEIGLPLSLLEAPADADTIVLEMGGAYAFGELAQLAGIARPSVGVVTNVHPVHLERMGTIEAIAKTKSELVRSLPDDGLAILNGDDPRVRAMAGMTKARVIFYGLGSDNHVRADTVTTDGLKGASFWLFIDGDRNFVRVPFVGVHGVQVALVAFAVGHGLGMQIAPMLAGLQDPEVQVRLTFAPGPGGSQLIDDTYNASPPSVLSALGLLKDIEARRRIAVLGDMRELGDISLESHRLIGRRVADVADMVITYGHIAKVIAAEARQAAPLDATLDIQMFDETDGVALVDMLKDELRSGDVVLFKGSRGLRMENLVSAIRTDVVDNNALVGDSQ